MTNENSRPLVRREAMPSVRLRRCQESDLGMVKCPLSAWPSVHSRQHPLGKRLRGMSRQLVRILCRSLFAR